MYSYYRNTQTMPMDTANVMPVQGANVMPMSNAGMMPMQGANMMPMSNAGMLPMQGANVMPMSNTGMMPMQNANMMPMSNTGMMPMQNANVMPYQNAYSPMSMQNVCSSMAVSPAQYNQFAEMSTEDLENLYPQTYNIIQPVVESECDKWASKNGDKCPSKTEYESMVSDIYKKVEADVEAAIKNSPVAEERQFFGGGRRILRDFIGALLIGGLIRRRRRPFFFGSPFYGGSYGYPFY